MYLALLDKLNITFVACEQGDHTDNIPTSEFKSNYPKLKYPFIRRWGAVICGGYSMLLEAFSYIIGSMLLKTKKVLSKPKLNLSIR